MVAMELKGFLLTLVKEKPHFSFSLLLENCAPCPPPGVLTTPLLSGLPGSAPLTGRQAASLQLAQLKAQLALTQMNNVLTVGGYAPTLTSNTHIPAPGLPTKPPSPTAVAINLLNLLKIANTMSHPMYNPFAPGKQMPSQGPYGLSGGQMEMDPRRPPPHFSSGSNFSSSGSSGLTCGPSGGPIPSIMSLPGSYRPERNKITVDEDIDRCLDLNISRAREEVIQTSSSQNTQFTNVQRDIFPSSNKGMPSYLTSPSTLVNRSFTVDSSNDSLDWLPICQRGSEEESTKKYSSASSTFQGSGESLFSTSSEGKHMSSIPGLGGYDIKRPAKFVPPPEPIRPKYTSESASNILLQFGLEKEDLEHLISYPEDQITPENLPFILREIKLEKEKKTATAVQSNPYSATQPIRSMGEKDKFIPSMGERFNSDQISSTVLKPSKVIDYGHTGKYTTEVGNEVGRTVGSSSVAGVSGSLLYMDSFKPSSHVRDPLQRGPGELKTGPAVTSHGQMSSVSTVDSLRSPVAPSSSDPSKKLGVQASQTSTPLFPSFGLLNKDTDLSRLKPEGPKIPPPKQPEPARQASTQPQPFNPPCNLSRGVHPGRPGLVLIHSNDSHNNNKSKTQGQGLKASEQVSKIPAQQQPIQQTLQHQGPPPQKPQFQMHPQPVLQLKQEQQGLPASMPPRLALFPGRPALPTPPQVPIRPLLPMSAPVLLRPSLPTPAQGRMDAMPRMPPPVFKDQTSTPKLGPSKLPTPAMMKDYAAATPRIFPHTCCLCMKECTNMKDWLSHQNTSLHLDNCRLLRLRCPDWDGTTLEFLSGPGKGTQPSPTALGQSFHETRSHSLSPQRQRGSEDGKESPHHHYGSESRRQKRSSRSRSHSPQRHHSSDGQRERRSSRSPHTSRHSRRSRSRSYDRPTSSHHRSRSRSYERRSPPRKREAKRSSPRRNYERRSSPRRSDERHSSPRRSREARSPAERSTPQHKRSRSADRLAKRLLETTAVQSLSKQSNLEAMVKTLAPALLAELAKMKSSSNIEKKTSSAKSAKATSSRPKSGKSSSAKPMSAESLCAGKVRLSSVSASLSHDDIFDALEKFGKVKEVNIARASLQAVIHFEKEADAEKVKKLQCLQVKGLTVYVDKKMNVVSMKPQSAQKKSAESSTTSTGKAKTPALRGGKTIMTGQVAPKAKGVPTKQVAVKKPNTAGKSAVKPVGVKTTAGPGVQKTRSPVKTADADDSKEEATNMKPEGDEIKSAETPSETTEVMKTSDTTVCDEDKEEKMEVTPEAGTSSNPVKAETQPDALGVKDLESKSAAPENQPVAAKAESEELPLVSKTVDTEGTSEENQVEECLKVDSVRIKVEDVEPGKAEPEEPMEILSSAESKDQVSETVKPAAGVKTPPCSSPRKTAADPGQTQQTAVKTEEMLERDSSQVQPCPMEESETPAGKLKTETEQLQSPKKTETKQEDVSSHLTPEPVSDVDEPTSAEAKPDEAAAPPAGLFSLAATVKTEKEEQQKETKHAAEKTVKSSTPLSKDSHNEKQPPPQTRASVSPTPAEPIQSGSVKADMMAGKNEAGVVAVPTASHKSNENPERKRSPRAPVVPAENRATPDPSTSTMSVAALGNLEDDDAELPQINEEFFRVLTTALREHRLRQGEKKASEESLTISKTTSEGMKEENTPLTKDESKDKDNYTDPFDEFGFNFGDFVTVDEISEEMDDTLVEDTSVSLESTSRDATERQSPDVSSAASKTSTRSSKNCKSSTSFSSRSEKGSDSLSSTSESENKQKPSSEPPKFETKTSSVSGVKTSPSTPSSSVKTPPSSAQKSQSNKSKPPVRSSETSSSGRSTRSSSAAAIKSSAGTQQVGKKDVKPKENAVAKSDHQVSAESCSAKTVESELRMKTMKIQHAEGQSSQIQNLKSDFKNVKEMKKNEVKDKKKDMDGKSTEEKRGNNENTQILDSFKEKSDEQKNKDDNQDRRTEIQISGPEQDHLVQQGADNDNGPSDECQEMEVDESTKLQDGALKDQAATADDRETNQTPNSSKVKQHNDIRLSERVCEISKEVGQTSNEEDQNSLKQQDKTRTYVTRTKDSKIEKEESLEDFEEMVYEVVDSIEDDSLQEPSTKGSCSRRRTPRGNRKDEKTSPPVEEPKKSYDEEEVFTVLDSVEEESPSEKPVVTRSTRRRENTAKKAEENTKTKEDKTPTRRRCTPVRDSKEKQKEKTPKKDVPLKESAPTKSNSAVASTGHEDTTYMELDAVEYDQPTTQKPRKGRPKKDNKTSREQSEEGEEPVYQIVDSLEEDQENAMTVTSTLQKDSELKIEMAADFNTVSLTKLSEDKALTGRQCTPTRDSHEKVVVPVKESTPAQTSNAAVVNTGEEDTIVDELDAVEDGQPATQKPGRGRPKKKNKTSNKLTEEDEAVYQIVDTAEDDQDKIIMVASTHLEETEAKVEMTEDVNTVLFSKMKEDKILTRGQRTPTRGSQEKDIVPLKESTPTKKSDAAVASTGDEDSTYEELVAAGDGQATTQKPRRGRPKTDNKTSKKQTEEDEEPVYQIVDSVGDQGKNVMVEAHIRKESETKVEMAANANTNLFTKTKEDKNLTKRRHTPARDSQENDREKTPKPDVCVPPVESAPTKKNDARHLGGQETTYEVLNAVEEQVVEAATRASRRGRPKKDNKTSKKQTEYLKVDSPGKDEEEEEEATYQILDSVEDEVADDAAPIDQSECAKTSSAFADDDITKEMIRSLLNEEEGDTIYQIVDSLEEDQVQEETMTETAMQEERETTGDLVASTDHVLSSPSTVEPFGQTGGGKETQLAGKPLEDKEDLSAKGSDTEGKADVVGEDESLNLPNNHLGSSEESTLTSPKSKDTEATENILVNLDQVSEDEEDYPDDAAEEEELKKRQAAAQKRENDLEEKRSRERETRERRSRSSSRGGSRKSTREPEKTSQEDLEKVEVDAQDLVTLDEVGEDEVGEEAVTEAPTWEVELQDLVTLDEIVEEEEGQLEAPPQSLESQSKDSLQPETSSTLTETTQIEDNRDDDNHPKEPSSSSKRKLDDTTEESGNFVTVDEVGEVEEEEEKEAVTRKGRPRKRSRQTPVRKSTRGKTVKEENHRQEEEENKSLPPASLDSSSTLDTSGPSGDAQCETQRTEEGKNTEAASAEHQPLHNDGLRLGCEEAEKQEHRRADATAVDKRKRDLTGPEAKRSRSQSPSVSANLQLPPFNPRNPLGKEFVNPTSGFFCSLCSVFYLNEDTAKEIHCSSQEHYDNLKNYYQRLQQNVQGSPSD
ncbi:PREDICTED: zinc finger protein 638-like isoform X3 [Poecilia mexicana]|uniref:zinc finger protein 638-like isoform X3 n=1 Tax=Poecilia mexicana TaxID=48701 RepID=UPI00072E8D09|nr:PREDICTED: zinc finger protein 638-like isoform X3 [Poecilia mexicana]